MNGSPSAMRGAPDAADPSHPAERPYDPERAALEWRLARHALALALADPDGLGGVVLHGRHGPARDALLADLSDAGVPGVDGRPPAARAVRRIPPDADDDALLGGLDTTATLARGRPVHRPGLLDARDGATLLVGGAERLGTSVATRLCAWLEDASQEATRSPLVVLDESVDGSALVESALGERLALHVGVPELALAELRTIGEPHASATARDEHANARVRTPADVALSDERLDGIVRLAARLGIDSLRAPQLACRAARAAAWLDGREAVSDEDAALAVQLVLAARARALPDETVEPEPVPDDAPDEAEPSAEEPPVDEPAEGESPQDADPPSPDEPADIEPPPDSPRAEDAADDARDDPLPEHELPERLVAAVTAALPRNLLDELAAGRAARAASAGRDASASADATRSGRPIGTRRARGGRSRPNLLATLKAAIPWQRLRAIEADGIDVAAAGVRPPLRVRRDDFRVTRYRRPTRTTTLFVVDASGSAAMHRLAEAKGAVEGLLAECYVRRDRVALVTFRGTEASLDLPPTRSLVRARRALAGLPGGGGTPLAAGLDLAAEQLERLVRDGESPVGVIMTDGRGNVARDGAGSRPRARDDAEQAARRLARIGARLLLVDTGPRPRPEPQRLAALMRARYLPLPELDVAEIGAGGRVR